MILDKQNLFSDAQTLVASVGAFASTNVIDLGIARDIGGATRPEMQLVCQIVTTYLASGGASTLTVALQTSADNSSWTTLASSAAIAKATLVAGYEFGFTYFPDPTSRYLRLLYTIATNDGTAGAITAGFAAAKDLQAYYARGYTA